ncbi:hypothetical protein ACFPGO_00605 [Arcanobacterium canis]|uniref:Primosomal protein N' 3' DNA-binding domain-containing protein n=1 Tax=Arcanobacterium canis TaxID=999183 RepID=A0ABY8FVW2_9ACTO|nr:hypothetical protein [Arcanobacterium canis]WFM82638.1 hypothetical protein P7079_04290 [Arcanobacterium canis]
MDEVDDLFSLGEAQAQEELLALEPVRRTLTGDVESPVAHVRLDMPQPHMDRTFDYEIPQKFASVPVGARVVVPIGQRKVDAFVVARDSQTTVSGALRPLARVYSDLPVLSKNVERLCEVIAQRQAASVADCLRLAVPQRHARAEKEFVTCDAPKFDLRMAPQTCGVWDQYAGAADFIAHIGHRGAASVRLAPAHKIVQMVKPIVETTLSRSKSILIVVPTPVIANSLARQLADLDEPIAVMTSQTDQAQRYTQFLAVRFHHARIVIGTRNAAWAPIENLGCAVIVDDHHSAMREPRSPYIHVRELLRVRCELEDATFMSLSYAPSLPLIHAARQGEIELIEPYVWNHSTSVHVLDAADFVYESAPWSRMPSSVFSVIRSGLEKGPVLVTVPRAGYIPLVACARCRQIASCSQCGGTLEIDSPQAPPHCHVCAAPAIPFRCPNCHFTKLRAVRIGSHRTAQEIGRAFRDVPIHLNRVGESISQVDGKPKIVVSTPGVAPATVDGYAAGVVLDAGYLLHSVNLDAETYFLRSVAHIAARIKPRNQGGKLLVVGDVPHQLISLVTSSWDAWARKALIERETLSQPPVSVWCEVTGEWDDLRTFLSILRTRALASGLELDHEVPLEAILIGGAHGVIPGMSVLGPQPARGAQRTIFLRFDENLRVHRTSLIRAAIREVSAAHAAPTLRVKMDAML